MYQLYFYVPESHKESVKAACFAAGAGTIGDYSHCAWEIQGHGQFLPGEHSTPFLGQPGQLEREAEYRVEMVLIHEIRDAVRAALLESHPYEEPAYGFIALA